MCRIPERVPPDASFPPHGEKSRPQFGEVRPEPASRSQNHSLLVLVALPCRVESRFLPDDFRHATATLFPDAP